MEEITGLVHIKPTFKQVNPDLIATVDRLNSLHILLPDLGFYESMF